MAPRGGAPGGRAPGGPQRWAVFQVAKVAKVQPRRHPRLVTLPPPTGTGANPLPVGRGVREREAEGGQHSTSFGALQPAPLPHTPSALPLAFVRQESSSSFSGPHMALSQHVAPMHPHFISPSSWVPGIPLWVAADQSLSPTLSLPELMQTQGKRPSHFPATNHRPCPLPKPLTQPKSTEMPLRNPPTPAHQTAANPSSGARPLPPVTLGVLQQQPWSCPRKESK
ncbi:uncharacterized protein C6orf132 homolog [Trachypithecus francoisi]|uniref:uncharacterized protein C6orf132 homolog n=1 Tax=Trachypithecus francoisi TaxID=54180 RepID=UPI00141AA639|nr:uncharacterized protein C6orf132 homolog [Trachypithecus francoisi]